jgi:hypothetical protein
MLHDAIFTATCNAVSGDSLYGASRESIEMARVQRKWRESNENGASPMKMARVTSSEARVKSSKARVTRSIARYLYSRWRLF